MCRLLDLKGLVYFYFDVGRLLFGDLLRTALLKIFLNFEIFFEDNSLVIKKVFYTCGYKLYKYATVVICLALGFEAWHISLATKKTQTFVWAPQQPIVGYLVLMVNHIGIY